MAISIKRITNANMYSSIGSLLGKVEEITLPSIKAKIVDVTVLGLVMASELPSGFEKMTGKVKFNAVYPELIEEFGNPFVKKQVQVRASLEDHDSSGRVSEKPVVAFITISFKDVLPAITFKQNDNPEQESEYSCTYYRLEVDGERMIEVDSFANIFFVKDVDQLAQYRANLGF